MSATTPPPHTIRWGIIGCGNVTEVKSGPAFRKIEGSDLVMVMRVTPPWPKTTPSVTPCQGGRATPTR
ncbi:MAG: hypothetical protein R2873_02390 [Caldilineaceae bacterium]